MSDYIVPDSLKDKIQTVRDNRKPGQKIVLDPKVVVHLLRDDIEKWLAKKAEEQQLAANP